MRNIFFISIGLFVVMLSSCRSHRQVVQQTTTDSTTVTFREVEKIVHIEGDTVSVNMTIVPSTPSDSAKPVEFIPQVQMLETARTKVKIELTRTGEIKATAISKDVEEKVIVQEKTISNYKSEVTEYQVKESWLAKAQKTLRSWIKGILFFVFFITAIYAVFKLGFNPISIVKNLFKKS